ncbi:MAG: DUF4340 domain-containing protein [bacterium]|nr:DUF4340 domain-containing protein [bacterium]
MGGWRNTLILVAIAGGIGAWAYFVEAKKDAPAPTIEEVTLWDRSQDASLKRLTVSDDASRSAVYVRLGESDWRYEPDASRSLDTFGWDTPFGNVRKLVADRKIGDRVEKLSDFGLDRPVLRVALGSKEQPQQDWVELGAKDSLDGSTYYARTSKGSAVYQVGSWKVDGWMKLLSAPPVASPSPQPAAAPAASVSLKP